MKENTLSVCPVCASVVEAEIEKKEGRVSMSKRCALHGEFETVISTDSEFYELMRSNRDRSCEEKFAGTEKYLESDYHLENAREVYIDVTEKCNLTCAQCFSNANKGHDRFLPKETIMGFIPRLKKVMPKVGLCGGEPTLHEDLPEIIARYSAEGFTVRLLTNGLRLAEEGYLEKLAKAGLRWVILQFDGFNDETYKLFRGRPLSEIKEKVIRKLSENKINVILAVMVSRGVNSNEMYDIIRYAMKIPHIVQVAFLPCANQGRHLLDEKTMSIPEVFDELERTTGSKISREDFLASQGLARTLWKFFGIQQYKPRTCHLGMYYFHDDEVEISFHRVLSPLFMLKNLKRLPKILAVLWHIVRWDKSAYHPNLLGVVIERFRDARDIDLMEATNCHKGYITENGIVPNCIYNTLTRVNRAGA